MKTPKNSHLADLDRFTGVSYQLLTWNIWASHSPFGRWPKRLKAVVSMLRDRQPDVFGLQEINRARLLDLEEALPDYAWTGLPRDQDLGAEYNPVFYSRTRFELLWHETQWLSATPSLPSRGWDAAHPRVVTMVRLRPTFGDNRDFMIMNCHLDHLGSMAKKKSVELLGHLMGRAPATLPVALMGDFNFSPSSANYRRLLSGHLLQDSALQLPGSDRHHPRKTWRGFLGSGLGGNRLDYIFIRNMAVHKYEVIRPEVGCTCPSDHYPVLGEFTFHQE